MANSAGQGARGGRAPPVANSPLAYPRPGQAGNSGAEATLATLTAAAMSAMMLNMEPPAANALHHAARCGDVEKFETLLNIGANIAAVDNEGRTCLHHAVLCGHLPICEAVVRHGHSGLLLAKDLLSCTPFHLAAVQNQVQFILCLVKALCKDHPTDTPLHYIASRGCMQDLMGFLHLGWDAEVRAEVGGHGPVEDIAPLPTGDGWAAARGAFQGIMETSGFIAARAILRWAPEHFAAMEGHVPLLLELLDIHGADLHARSANNWTPLHYAAANNHVSAIEALVSRGADLAATDTIGYTPLHVAAGEGHLAAVQQLVALGAPPALKDRDGCTPLFTAVVWNRKEVAEALVALGCPPLIRSAEMRSPVHVAAEQGWASILPLLVSRLGNQVDAKDAYNSTPLHSAANWGWADTVRELLKHGHDPGPLDYLGRSPLHYAALHGRCEAIHELTVAKAPLDVSDSRGGFTPLHLAADAGQCDAITELSYAGANLDLRNDKGLTPLGLATTKGPINVDVIGLLADLGADVNCLQIGTASADIDADQPFLQEQQSQELPLHVAARSGRPDVIRSLLRAGCNINLRTKDGSTALHYAAAFGQASAVEALVEAGCRVDWLDNAANTPLHLAAGCGFLDTCQALVRLGADVMARDVSHCTPLHNAAHGTYSALAAMPPGSGAPGMLPGTVPPMRLGGLPGAMQQPTMESGMGQGKQGSSSAAPRNVGPEGSSGAGGSGTAGLVPVRTGLAWAALSNSNVSSLCMFGEEEQRPMGNWRGLELLKLLKKTTRARRQLSTAQAQNLFGQYSPSRCSIATQPQLAAVDNPLLSAPPQDSPLSPFLYPSASGFGSLPSSLGALSSQFTGIEQDRSRLIGVSSSLVSLGASVAAVDNEGRTPLHLASGCGDRDMVKNLVELGGDINSLDHMGGTPMHHAAMANKKDMMFTLARMGCDWRTRADGIDGATAAYVLCGQHGKTSRQQKLLEAKLKRMAQEGDEFRQDGQPVNAKSGRAPVGITSEVADANMAALLEEVTEEERQKGAKRNKPKKKKTAKASKSAVVAAPEKQVDAKTGESGKQGHCPEDKPVREAAETSCTRPSEKVCSKKQSTDEGAGKVEPLPQSAVRRKSETDGKQEGDDGAGVAEDSDKTAAREELKAAVEQAQSVLDVGAPTESECVLKRLDTAISQAVEANVSAKYAKKVRKRIAGLACDQSVCTLRGEDTADVAPVVVQNVAFTDPLPAEGPAFPCQPRILPRKPAQRTAYHPMAQRAVGGAAVTADPKPIDPPPHKAAPPSSVHTFQTSAHLQPLPGSSAFINAQGAPHSPQLPNAQTTASHRASYTPNNHRPLAEAEAAANLWGPPASATMQSNHLDAQEGWLPLGVPSSGALAGSLFHSFTPGDLDSPLRPSVEANHPGSALRMVQPADIPTDVVNLDAPMAATRWGMPDAIWGGFSGGLGLPSQNPPSVGRFSSFGGYMFPPVPSDIGIADARLSESPSNPPMFGHSVNIHLGEQVTGHQHLGELAGEPGIVNGRQEQLPMAEGFFSPEQLLSAHIRGTHNPWHDAAQ